MHHVFPPDAEAGLAVALHSDGETTRVLVTGELDMATAPLLLASFEQLPHGCTGVVVDVSGLAFMDVAGLRMLATSHDAAIAAGRSFRLTRAVGAVQHLLDLASVQGSLPFVHTNGRLPD
jgi:anti-sigma B factor antagonist